MKHFFWVPLILFGFPGFGQLGSWNILTTRVHFSDRWSASLEGQIRSLRYYQHFHYFEYKAGIFCAISENLTIGSLVGHYRTYSEGGTFTLPFQSNELRTCVQLVLKQNIRLVNIEHRYRIEQRFTSNGYRNRFRYRIGVVVPLSDKSKTSKSWTFTTWNEVFLTNKAPYFERNRFFAGVGYSFSESFSMSGGYVWQLDYNLTDETGRDFFQIGFLYELGIKTKFSNRQIGD